MIPTRFALARQRLSTCNYFLAGLALAVAGCWDEIKPLLVDVLTGFGVPADKLSGVVGGLSILAIVVRAGWALRPPAAPAPAPAEGDAR